MTTDSPVDDYVQSVLMERARALARAPEDDDSEGALLVLGFTVGDQRYAVEARWVREVVRAPVVSRVPWAPRAVVGVINVRGEVLAVADLGRLLGVTGTRTATSAVILDGAGPPVALLVDDVDDIASIPAGSVIRPPDDGAASATPLTLFVGADSIVLDGHAVLTDTRLFSSDDRSADATDRS